MKIYFNFSARATNQYFHEFSAISNAIGRLEHTNTAVFTEDKSENEVYSKSEQELESMFNKAIKRIQNSHVVVLEVSIHSLTQGYLIYRALDIGVPVIALHLPGTKQAFARAIKHDKFQLVEYTADTITRELEQALNHAKAVMDTRFNFFMSPKISAYLDALSQERGTSKSDVMRQIILEHMQQNALELDGFHT